MLYLEGACKDLERTKYFLLVVVNKLKIMNTWKYI